MFSARQVKSTVDWLIIKPFCRLVAVRILVPECCFTTYVLNDTMEPTEANKLVVQAYVKAFNQGDMLALRTVFAPDALV